MKPSEIRDWIDRHPESLPRTLDDLAQFPQAFRGIMVNMVSPDVRLSLWREHLESFLNPESPLNADQRALVVATIPELSSLLAAPAPNATMSEWERRAAQVFSPQEAGRVFMRIGPPEPPEGIPLPADALPTPSGAH